LKVRVVFFTTFCIKCLLPNKINVMNRISNLLITFQGGRIVDCKYGQGKADEFTCEQWSEIIVGLTADQR